MHKHLAGPSWSFVARHHISGDKDGIALMAAVRGETAAFFVANDIVDAEKKRVVFLSVVGPATYKLLGDLLAPAKSGDKSYEELVEVVTHHCNPTPSEIVEKVQVSYKIQETRRIGSDVCVRTEVVGEIL